MEQNLEQKLALAVVMAYKIDSMKFNFIGYYQADMLFSGKDDKYGFKSMAMIKEYDHSNIMESLEESFKICELPKELVYPFYLADHWSNDLIDWAEKTSGVSFNKVSLTKNQYSVLGANLPKLKLYLKKEEFYVQAQTSV